MEVTVARWKSKMMIVRVVAVQEDMESGEHKAKKSGDDLNTLEEEEYGQGLCALIELHDTIHDNASLRDLSHLVDLVNQLQL
jgi:hypothetical protein